MNEIASEIRNTLLAIGPATFGAVAADIADRQRAGSLMFHSDHEDLRAALFDEWQAMLCRGWIEPAGEGRSAWKPLVGFGSGEESGLMFL